MQPETKAKLMKALPWILGGAVVLFLVLKLNGGSGGGGGQRQAQDLSNLGGGGGGSVGPVVPSEVAQQVADQWSSSRERFLAMRDSWNANQENQPTDTPTGVVAGIWHQLSSGNWQSSKNPNNIISEQQAQILGPQNHGPYAQGKGGFLKQAWNDFIKPAAQLYAASQGVPIGGGTPAINPTPTVINTPYRGTMPGGNGNQRAVSIATTRASRKAVA